MPFEKSSIIIDTKLSKKTIEKLLNEFFSLDRTKNEEIIKKFAKEKNIEKIYQYMPTYNLHLLKIVGFGHVSDFLNKKCDQINYKYNRYC